MTVSPHVSEQYFRRKHSYFQFQKQRWVLSDVWFRWKRKTPKGELGDIILGRKGFVAQIRVHCFLHPTQRYLKDSHLWMAPSADMPWDFHLILPNLASNRKQKPVHLINIDKWNGHKNGQWNMLLLISRHLYNRSLIIQSLCHWLLGISLHK